MVLHDVKVAAEFVGNPPVSFANGLFMGFLMEADAVATIIPPSIAVIGGKTLSSILPGGTGNCFSHDDRDVWNEESGWWFYFNFVAAPVEFDGR